jgi:hypothetical protein
VSSPEAARHELHERSKRAIETAVFPDNRVRKDQAQAHIERLLERDSRDGELGQIILRTGKPGYKEAFVKYLGGVPLTGDRAARVLAVLDRPAGPVHARPDRAARQQLGRQPAPRDQLRRADRRRRTSGVA